MLLVRTHPVARGIKIGSNQPPQWQSSPSPSFTLGVASNYPPSGTYQSNSYVTDANGDTITITWISGSVSGVTWDGGKFVYDGFGSAGTTGSLVLRANDGTDVTDSPAFSIEIVSNLAWSATPIPSFVEASVTPLNLGAYVTNYSSATDVFTVTPGYSLPVWLSLTGTGGVNLTPNGTQVDADDVAAIPGIKIRVTRSGGSFVDSSSFGVTVTAAPAATGSIDDFAFEGLRTVPNWTDPQGAGTRSLSWGKHTRFQYCSADQKIYGLGGDGVYPGMVLDSSGVRFPRFSLTAGLVQTYDNFYPHFGVSTKDFPVGMDDHTWMWDASRGCFWMMSGYSALVSQTFANIGNAIDGSLRVWRYWVTGALAGQFENLADITSIPGAAHYGQGKAYVPSIDCIVWPNYIGTTLYWYNCATGAFGNKPTDFSPDGEGVNSNPVIYDSGNHELIFMEHVWRRGLYAVSLDNLFSGGACHVRTLVSGMDSQPQMGQSPMWIRNRKLYRIGYPKVRKALWPLCGGVYSDGSNQGNGLGLWEISLDDAVPVVNKGSLVWGPNVVNNGLASPIMPANEGDYHAALDVVLATSYHWIQGSATYIYKYGVPSWVPSENQVIALTTDWQGSSAKNTLLTVWQGSSAQFGSGVTAWMSGALCRDMSTNGMMLFQGGGDADYFGNEVFAFDFDTRRFYRLSDRCTALRGGSFRGVDDAALPTNDPQYFNLTLCEHGPLVDDSQLTGGGTNWGLLPVNATTGVQATQPGVPHLYDGAVWVPGSWIGNERGAFVRPHSTFVYGPGPSTNRAHYFDLDELKWGRLTQGGAGGFSYVTQCAINEADGIIYYQGGQVNLATKQQTAANWWGGDPGDWSCDYDPVRGLLIKAGGNGVHVCNVAAPGSTINVAVSLTGAAMGSPVFSGIVYCSDLDVFFLYNSRLGGPGATPAPNTIWKVTPPSGSRSSDSGTLAAKRTIALAGTWQMENITMGGTSIAHGDQLTYGNIAYVPKLKCIAIHIPGGYMYLYRPVGL